MRVVIPKLTTAEKYLQVGVLELWCWARFPSILSSSLPVLLVSLSYRDRCGELKVYPKTPPTEKITVLLLIELLSVELERDVTDKFFSESTASRST